MDDIIWDLRSLDESVYLSFTLKSLNSWFFEGILVFYEGLTGKASKRFYENTVQTNKEKERKLWVNTLLVACLCGDRKLASHIRTG